jgi:putative membrane protein
MNENVRDHLANERTFLAWVRTSLGMIGLGFVLARMGLFLRQIAVVGVAGVGLVPGRAFHAGHEFLVSGVVFLAIGTVLGAWSGWVYQRTRRSIDEGRFEPARGSVLALTAVVVVGSLVIIGLVTWRVLIEG